ncbi:hypothetical protein AB0J35_55095 [Nonomuraea angiospora]|uniref:hypothetical protein n=1 Tax=Nonomuraea angiospora TaxID=46172 RepID=UPI0034410939
MDVEYHDDTHGYVRQEDLEIPGTAVAPVQFRIALLVPAHRTFRHWVTVVTTAVDGEKTLLGIAWPD